MMERERKYKTSVVLKKKKKKRWRIGPTLSRQEGRYLAASTDKSHTTIDSLQIKALLYYKKKLSCIWTGVASDLELGCCFPYNLWIPRHLQY
jgi:hypothetical protein